MGHTINKNNNNNYGPDDDDDDDDTARYPERAPKGPKRPNVPKRRHLGKHGVSIDK
jgi:hypothetical protein